MAQSVEQLRTEYRRQLIALEQKSIESFDKTVLTLSGGALGLSLTFLRSIVDLATVVQTQCLLAAWIFWVVSLICVLLSFWMSARAMRKAIQQVDNCKLGQERLGGFWNWATENLTFGGGLFFIFGAFAIISFIHFNL